MYYYLIFMAVRLIEPHRVLNDTGSIYLHCDPHASHYLKVLMDYVFGKENFRNEVVWSYRKMPNKIKAFQKNNDILLFYAKGIHYVFNTQYAEPSSSSLQTFEHARRIGYNANKKKKMVTVFDWHKYRQAIQDGKIPPDLQAVNFSGGNPPMRSVWVDLPIISPSAKERIGYPTQKPLALLDRIIKASSNAGDLVLDPFCGCTTTCMAAELNGRQWIGIDINPQAFYLSYYRSRTELKAAFDFNIGGKDGVDMHLKSMPEVDLDDLDLALYVGGKPRAKRPSKRYRDKYFNALYDAQEGQCWGCLRRYDERLNYELDHLVPLARGGTNARDNFQVLCFICNKAKRDKDMAYLIRKNLEERRITRVQYKMLCGIHKL